MPEVLFIATIHVHNPRSSIQTCIIDLIRNTFGYASRKYWNRISADLRPIYTAATPAEARLRYEESARNGASPTLTPNIGQSRIAGPATIVRKNETRAECGAQ